ncbi:MAG: chorismate mutase [Treponemataceae bacterium]|nr:MAG: chorismate mutase [Treponemataceae bacterium]
MQKRLCGIRGAVCAENTRASIIHAVEKLFTQLYAENRLQQQDLVSIQWTVTDDLTEINPAAALRESVHKDIASKTALFCAAEPNVKNALPQVIRLLVTAYAEESAAIHHVYIDGAEKLRPDLCLA